MEEMQNAYHRDEQIPSQILNPTEVYGRANELLAIKKAIAHLHDGKSVRLELVGESGVGKTQLLQKAFSDLQGVHAFSFAFHNDSGSKPYHLLNEIFDQLLVFLKDMKSDSELSDWYGRVTLLLDRLPEDVLKSLPFLSDVSFRSKKGGGSKVSSNTAQKLLEDFYVDFGRELYQEIDRKIILTIENLHQADHRTHGVILKIFESVQRPIMLVLSGRFGDWRMLDRNNHLTHEFIELTLSNLEEEKVGEFIEFSLGKSVGCLAELSKLLFETTSGNPRMLIETLRKLIKEKNLSYKKATKQWEWEVDSGLFKSKMSIVSLFLEKYDKLGEDVKELLDFCSCLGANINAALIVKLTDYNLDQVVLVLDNCCKEGFLDQDVITTQQGNSSRSSFHFSSDDVAEAIHNLLESNAKGKYHRLIASHLMKRSAIGIPERDIFEAATHLNQSFELTMTDDERLDFVKLNIRAAKKSRLLTSFRTGYDYMKHALELADSLSWEQHGEVLSEIFTEAYQLARLNSDSESEKRFMAIAKKNFGKNELFEIQFVKMVLDIQFGMLQEGLQTGLQILDSLGFTVKAKASRVSVLLEFLKTRRTLKRITVDEIYALPEINDDRLNKIFQVMFWLYRASQYLAPELNGVLALKQLQLMLKHGTNGEAWSGLMAYGVIIGAGMYDYDAAFRYSDLGGRLADKYGNKSGKVAFGKAIYWPFKHPLEETLEMYELSKTRQYHEGDYVGAAEATVNESLTYVSLGRSWDEISQKVSDNLSFCNQSSAVDFSNFQQMLLSNLHCLKEGKDCPDEQPSSNDKNQTEYALTYSVDLIFKLKICFLKGNVDEAMKLIEQAKKAVTNLTGLYFKTEFDFYCALTYLTALGKGGGTITMKRKVKKIIRNFEKWSGFVPANYEHKKCLLKGMEYTLSKDYGKAQDEMNKALRLTEDQENAFVQGIVLDQLAKVNSLQDQRDKEAAYQAASSEAFKRWGIEWK